MTIPTAEHTYNLSQYEGWKARFESPRRSRPRDLSSTDLGALNRRDRLLYDDARSVWHANLGPYLTPDIKYVIDQLDLIVQSNRQDGDRVRSAAVLDAYPGLGKTTLVCHYGGQFHRDQLDMYGTATEAGDDRVPVAYVRLTSNTTMRSLNSMLCHFYAHPAADRGNATVLGARASQRALDCATRLIIVDDVHFLDMNRRDGREVANHFKWLANEFAATFLFVGVGITERGLLSEGLSPTKVQYAQTARRWTRTSLAPFSIDDGPGRKTWRSLLLAIERDLVLANKSPGMVADVLADYLYARSTGHFASLMTLICARLPACREDGRRSAHHQAPRHRSQRSGLRERSPATRGGNPGWPIELAPRGRVREPRRIPMRLPPLPGEAFESWLVAYAHRLDSPTSDILAQAGLSTSQVSTDPRTLALGPSADTLQRLSDVTGHDCSELESTFVPLRQYSAGLSKVRIHGTSFLGAPMRASRFCPECLDANGGRWMASWRLPWVVACPTHGILLATHCPDCESEQRRRPILTESTPNDPRHCANPASGSIGRAPTRCEADLTGVFTHPAPTALVHLSESWNEFHAVGRVTDLLRLVGDVAVLSSVIGTCASAGEALAHPEKFADVLAQAAEAVLDPEGSTFTELASRRVSRKAPALPAGWTGISEGLVSRALVIRDPSMRPLDRIRWASATRGRRPSEVRSDALSREGKVPASLWPEWALLLAPPGLESAAVFPAAAAGCMLLRGSTLPLSQLMKMLSDDPTASRSAARSILQATANDPGHTILPTLTKLSETLEAEPPPIDYARRRRWAAERDVLSRRDWVRLCEGTSSAPGEARKWRYARLRVWETLTGGMAHQAPSSLMAGMTDPLSVYYQFLRNLTPAVLQALTAHAREVLDAWGLEDEPVEWVPSLSIIGAPSDVLPGVSRQQLEGRVPIGSLAGRRALSDCAADVGLDIQQAKLIVRLGWFAPEPSPGRPARTRLSEAQVRDAIEVRGLTLRQTAAELGVDRKTVRQRCLELEIDLHAPGRRRRWNVDKEWLATQYVTRGRPLPDIAAEVGCSTANLARIAKEHGIPLRGRGGASHGSATVTTGDLPPLLAACLRGQGARERVERFHQIAAFRSLNEAAQSIGLHQSAISTQLKKLETAAGGRILERGDRQHAPLKVTPLGRKLLKQAEQELGLPQHPIVRAPLAPALGSFRGAERIAKLASASRQKTLREAAVAAGVTPQSLRISFRGLESACGPLVSAWGLDEAFHLTPRGQLLVRQWAAHHSA